MPPRARMTNEPEHEDKEGGVTTPRPPSFGPDQEGQEMKGKEDVPVSKLRRTVVRIEKSRSHLEFISQCLEEGIVPKGFSIDWQCHISNAGEIDVILRRTEREIMETCKQLLIVKVRVLER